MAVYEVITDPPLLVGAPKNNVVPRLPVSVDIPIVGLFGTPTVVIELEGDDATESPTELKAFTVNVYAVPAVNPVIVIVPLPACERVPVMPPGFDVAVYEVIAELPLTSGAINETDAVVAPVDVAVTEVGALGTVIADGQIFVRRPSLVTPE